jgi:hypothetical protein
MGQEVVIRTKIQELWRLSNGSFGRAPEQALTDFAGKAFLSTAIPSVQFEHALGIKGRFRNPGMSHKLAEYVILLGCHALKKGKATLLPLLLVVEFTIGKPDWEHKIDD